MKIHSFESLAALDGDGLRYGVYLIGCPLRCVYCHNPDTWNNAKYELSPRELAEKIKKYKPYFNNDGGVTFSGGEPLLWAKEINRTYKYLKEEDINYVLDTSGSVELDDEVKECINNSSLVILDLKFYDDEGYKKYTKFSINNTLKTLDYLEAKNIRCWIRSVVVPGINDNKDVLYKYVKILKNYTCIEKYELLAFHTMRFFKYEQLGIDNPLKDKEDLKEEVLKNLQEYVDEEMKK